MIATARLVREKFLDMGGKMQNTIRIKYVKPNRYRYCLFYGNKKVTSKTRLNTVSGREFRLVEYSPFLSRMWWVLVMREIVLGFFADSAMANDYNEKDNSSIRTIRFFMSVRDDYSDIVINIANTGHILNIQNVISYNVMSIVDTPNELIKKRIKRYRAAPFMFFGTILVLAAIAFTILMWLG